MASQRYGGLVVLAAKSDLATPTAELLLTHRARGLFVPKPS
jgi:hypothetical protein